MDVLKVVTPYVPTIRLIGYYDNLWHRMWVWGGAFLVLFSIFKVRTDFVVPNAVVELHLACVVWFHV
jgi:hypothetical protein